MRQQKEADTLKKTETNVFREFFKTSDARADEPNFSSSSSKDAPRDTDGRNVCVNYLFPTTTTKSSDFY